MTRKMASIQVIEEVKAIPNADNIEAYRVNGWWVVDHKGKHKVGDLVVYIEIDSWVPDTLAPFLSKGKTPRVYKGIAGEKLRTIKLRGQLSQGLLIKPDAASDTEAVIRGYSDDFGWGVSQVFLKGEDVSEFLKISKWEPALEFMPADTKGLFPSFIPKTDQERIQNCYKDVADILATETFIVEEKIEGQSSTIYFRDGEFGVCSRNLELKESDNTFWNTARKYNLENKLRKLGKNIAIQAEQVGPGISGNIYEFTEYFLFVFDVFDIDKQEYYTREEVEKLCLDLDLTPVPVLFRNSSGLTLQQILDLSDGKSVIGFTDTLREGLVWRKQGAPRLTFKSISNQYLCKKTTD